MSNKKAGLIDEAVKYCMTVDPEMHTPAISGAVHSGKKSVLEILKFNGSILIKPFRL